MSTSVLGPEAFKLFQRMTGPRKHHPSVGEPIDFTQIDALALGDLWAVAGGIDRWQQTLAAATARAVIARGRTITPAFRGAACRDYLELLVRQTEEAIATGNPGASFWKNAGFALARCIDPGFAGIAAAAERLLAASPSWASSCGRMSATGQSAAGRE